MGKLVKLIRLNNLEYNTNRDPSVYRRVVDKPFRIQALLGGSGEATAHVEVEGKTVCAQKLSLPGTYTCEGVSFNTPGLRIATVVIQGAGETFRQDLKLDVMEHAWIG